MSEETKSCGTCKHWNNPLPNGCDIKVADTGEVMHYHGNEDLPCPNWDKRGELK